MAKFVACTLHRANLMLYVNVEEIRFIEQHDGYSILRFDNQHSLTIQGPPAALLQADEKQ